jgi:CBS domain-containing protein
MSNPDPHLPRVQDVMTRHPTVVHGEDDAQALLRLFEEHDFNAVPVVDPKGDLLGVVTKLSLLRLLRVGSAATIVETANPVTLRVRDVMDTRRVSVEPTDGLDVAVRQMTRHRVRSVPVVEPSGRQRRLVGLVSRGDLLRRTPPQKPVPTGEEPAE